MYGQTHTRCLRAEARIRLQLCRDAVRIASHRGGDGCRRAHTEASTQTAPVDEPPVTDFVTPAPAFPHVAPVAVFEYVSPAPVIECGATGVNLDITGMVHPRFSSTAVEVSSSHVVGSLPLGEVSAATGVTLDYTGFPAIFQYCC